jgi:hypothetical protein
MSRRERLLNQLYSVPRNPEVDERKRRFDDINAFISQHGGWTTSVPGSHEITFDALVGSALPEQLAAMGYSVVMTGTSERVTGAGRRTMPVRSAIFEVVGALERAELEEQRSVAVLVGR